MAVSPTKKAKLISMGELPRVVDSAVKAAQARLGATLERGPIIKKWEINGRVVRDLALAQRFANEVSAEVAKSGADVGPAVLILDKDIICGFIERANIPVDRNF